MILDWWEFEVDESCFFDEVSNIFGLVHEDVYVTIFMLDIGKFDTKEVLDFLVEINSILLTEQVFELGLNFWARTKINKIINK